jgi:hypothetical protein
MHIVYVKQFELHFDQVCLQLTQHNKAYSEIIWSKYVLSSRSKKGLKVLLHCIHFMQYNLKKCYKK